MVAIKELDAFSLTFRYSQFPNQKFHISNKSHDALQIYTRTSIFISHHFSSVFHIFPPLIFLLYILLDGD